MKAITINHQEIGPECSPYIIAEMSANHNGSIESAFKIIEEAKNAGASAVKMQTYRADTLTIDSSKSDFMIETGLWAGKSLYELYESAFTPWEWHESLFDFAKKLGITLFSSPFDNSAVDLLESLNAPAYKIASFELIDLELIKYVASTGKPLIMSTGMANAEEIEEAIQAARDGGCEQLALLHCVSGYPAPAADYNLRTIPDMMERYNLVTGLSDHTLDNTTAIASVALGASIIEKHFTLNRNGGGPDDSFSLEPEGLRALCCDTKTAWEALGGVNYERKSSEMSNMKFRRSLFVVKEMKRGDAFTPTNVRSIRPGYGMKPKFYRDVLGMTAAADISVGTPLTHDLIFREDLS